MHHTNPTEIRHKTETKKAIDTPKVTLDIQDHEKEVVIKLKAEEIDDNILTVDVEDNLIKAIIPTKKGTINLTVSETYALVNTAYHITEEKKDAKGTTYSYETGTAVMKQSYPLPARVDVMQTLPAEYKNGELTLHILKKESKKITVLKTCEEPGLK